MKKENIFLVSLSDLNFRRSLERVIASLSLSLSFFLVMTRDANYVCSFETTPLMRIT